MSRRSPALVALAALLVASCSDAAGPGDDTPARLEVESGGTQEGVAGEALGTPVVVRVTDGDGDPVRGVPVTWTIASGGGAITSSTDSTDGNGRARALWRLGTLAREQVLEARAASLEPAAATATASGRAAAIAMTLDADSIAVGGRARLSLAVTDNFGDLRADLVPAVTSTSAAVLVPGDSGWVRAMAEGTATLRASLHGIVAQREVRAWDVPTSVSLVASRTTLDVAESATLGATVLGRTGRTLVREVAWRCEGADVVAACGETLRPKLVPLAEPAQVRVIASAGAAADTLAITIVEEPITRLQVSWPPAPFSALSDWVPVGAAAPATVGDTTRLLVLAFREQPTFAVLPNRPFRISAQPEGIVALSLGGVLGGQERLLHAVGLAEGTAQVTVAANGATVSFNVTVTARTAATCGSGALALDLPLGERRTFRAGVDAPACLEFRQDRDAGGVWMVLADALPRATPLVPQWAAEQFNFEGQGMFRESAAPEPRHFPTVRMHSMLSGGQVAAVTTWLSEQAIERHPGWRTPKGILREGPMRREAIQGVSAPQASISTPEGGQQAATTTVVAVGDTLWLPGTTAGKEGLTTIDGQPMSDRAVITHMGEKMIVAELVDVLSGRLRYADGTKPKRIPADQLARLEEAYAVPRAQLDSLLPGTPLEGSIYTPGWGTRSLGGREMVINVPLPAGFWGFAGPNYVVVDYWLTSFDGLPPNPTEITDQVLAHEFTHMRHMSKYWDLSVQLPPWVVEGFASFAEGASAVARLTGSADPARNLRLTTRPPGQRSMPTPPASALSSFFRGYDESSYLYDYLADQVAARGGHWRTAVLDLVRNAHSQSLADAAVASHLPGLGAHDLAVQARTAAQLELMRSRDCAACIAPSASLPDWTRFLQYDVPALSFGAFDAPYWPRLVPGAGSGAAFTLRTGAMWPVLIDGRTAGRDDAWVIDLSGAPEMVLTVVRIR